MLYSYNKSTSLAIYIRFFKNISSLPNMQSRKNRLKRIKSKENIPIHAVVPWIESIVKPHIGEEEVWLLIYIIRFWVGKLIGNLAKVKTVHLFLRKFITFDLLLILETLTGTLFCKFFLFSSKNMVVLDIISHDCFCCWVVYPQYSWSPVNRKSVFFHHLYQLLSHLNWCRFTL